MSRSEHVAIEATAASLLRLSETRPGLANSLARVAAAVAEEAERTPRFARALEAAMEPVLVDEPPLTRRSARRASGVLDPFAIYAREGEGGLRMKLETLSLEQLRDIVAEHGMDQDRLAMRWKQPSRVADRIVERVASRSAKGSAFRTISD